MDPPRSLTSSGITFSALFLLSLSLTSSFAAAQSSSSAHPKKSPPPHALPSPSAVPPHTSESEHKHSSPPLPPRPPPPPAPKRSARTPPEPKSPRAESSTPARGRGSLVSTQSRRQERGRTAGLALMAVAGMLQIGVVTFLLAKRKQMLKAVGNYEEPVGKGTWSNISSA